MLLPRFPEWTAGEPIADCIINAMWLYLMTYKLADEEKFDETSVCLNLDGIPETFLSELIVSPFLYMPEGELASAMRFSSPTVYVHSLIKLWDSESPSNLKVFGKLLFYVSFGLELGIHTTTFDMDLSDFMDVDQPMSYEKAYKYFSRDPSQRWCCWNNTGLND
nr:tubulin--tyrosine ligase-like protein 12 [Ipomoea batatas]